MTVLRSAGRTRPEKCTAFPAWTDAWSTCNDTRWRSATRCLVLRDPSRMVELAANAAKYVDGCFWFGVNVTAPLLFVFLVFSLR